MPAVFSAADVAGWPRGPRETEAYFRQTGQLEAERAKQAAHAAASVAPGEGPLWTDDGTGTLTPVVKKAPTPPPAYIEPNPPTEPFMPRMYLSAGGRIAPPLRFDSGGFTGGGGIPTLPPTLPGTGGGVPIFTPGGATGGRLPLTPGGGYPGLPSGLPGTGAGSGGITDAACALLPSWAQGICRAGGRRLFDPGSGQTVPTTDPTPGTVTPAEASTGASGLMAPMMVQRNRLECPRVPGQPRGIVHVSPFTGEYVCLPKGVSGAAFGLVRKNKPRKKPPFSHAEWKAITGKVSKTDKKKARMLAKATGISCGTRR